MRPEIPGWNGSHWIRPEKRLAIYHRDGFSCVYCGAAAEDGILLSLDHVVPRELGGSNDATNLLTSCISCNCRKNMESLDRFLAEINVDAETVKSQLARKIDKAEGKRLLSLRKKRK